MDKSRLHKLAGIKVSLNEELQNSIKEMDLLEKMYPARERPGFTPINTDTSSVEEVQMRLDAAKRAIGLVNKLKDPNARKAHFSRIRKNMNSINAALAHMEKNMGGSTEAPMGEPPVQ